MRFSKKFLVIATLFTIILISLSFAVPSRGRNVDATGRDTLIERFNIEDVIASPDITTFHIDEQITFRVRDFFSRPIIHCKWDFDDDAKVNRPCNQEITHSYSKEGDYEVELDLKVGDVERKVNLNMEIIPYESDDPCADIICPKYCDDNILYGMGKCEEGVCEYDQETCDDGCHTTQDRCKEPTIISPIGIGTDIDSDGINNPDDSCPNTPTDETANELGCSCSQLTVETHQCSESSCEGGLITYTNQPSNTECGNERECPDNTCVGTKFYSYPEEGHDACNDAGICIEYDCTPTIQESSDCQQTKDNDADDDGISDDTDNCPTIENSNQDDLDQDSIGDVCDVCPNDSNNDVDEDEICGDIDNCPDKNNKNQQDVDGDGIGNVCDSTNNDIDEDRINNNRDNCPHESNPNQEDSDDDGYGDACDFCPNDSNNDVDGDNICGEVDNCPTTSNPNQEDIDQNYVGDECETQTIEDITAQQEDIDTTIQQTQQTVENNQNAADQLEQTLEDTPKDQRITIQREIEHFRSLEFNAEKDSKKAEEESIRLFIKKAKKELKEKKELRKELENELKDASEQEKDSLKDQITQIKTIEENIKQEIKEAKELLKEKEKEVKEIKNKVIKQEIRKKVIEHVKDVISNKLTTSTPTLEDKKEIIKKIKDAPGVKLKVSKEKAKDTLANIFERILQKEKTEAIINNIKEKEKELTTEELNLENEKLEQEIEEESEQIDEKVETAKDNVDKTAEVVKIEKVANYYEEENKENTIITLTITPSKTLEDFTIYEEIPKEIAKDISQITIFNENYVVIDADPLIMWHFVKVDKPIDISYEVKKKVNVETIEEAVTVSVANKISTQAVAEDSIIKESKKEPPSFFSFLFPILMIPLIGGILIYYNKFAGEETEKIPRSLYQAIQLIKNFQNRGMKKDAIRKYMAEQGWPNPAISSAFISVEGEEHNRIQLHLGTILSKIRKLSRKGMQIEEIRTTLTTKKGYPQQLVNEGISKFKSINRGL